MWDPAKEHLALLAVPVVVGKDVLGVLRLFCHHRKQDLANSPRGVKTRFDRNDQDIVVAVARKVAKWLAHWQQHHHRLALRRAEAELEQAVDPKLPRINLYRAIYGILEATIGPCLCLLRVVDRLDAISEVLDLRFQGGPSKAPWPQFRVRGEGVSGRVWDEGQMWVTQDTHSDERLAQILQGTKEAEQWRQYSDSAVNVPIKVADPKHAEKVAAVLTIHRQDPHRLLHSDVDFISQLVKVIGMNLDRLAKSETVELERDFYQLAFHYLQERDFDPASQRKPDLLRRTCSILARRLGAHGYFGNLGNQETGYVWMSSPASAGLPTLPARDPGRHGQTAVPTPLFIGLPPTPGLHELSAAEVQRELKDHSFVVVPCPDKDKRLQGLLNSLPPMQRALCEGRQRATFVLRNQGRVHALFFFVIQSPHRLSYDRFEQLVGLVNKTVGNVLGSMDRVSDSQDDDSPVRARGGA